MINIFEYTDYRKFLADYYNEQKAGSSTFSYKSFSNKAGFPNKGYIYNIICGRKNLSKSSIVQLCKALELSGPALDYFEALVFFNQSKNLNERNHYYSKLSSVRSNGKPATRARQLRKDQYEFYSQWYHVIIRSLIGMHEIKDDYERLARMVQPRILPRQAKQSVQLLARLGLIAQQKNGVWKIADKSITTGDEVKGVGVQNFHLACMRLAERAIQQLPREKRNITGLTLGISKKTYDCICEEIQRFQSRIMEMADNDDNADRVYQFNFHLFPASTEN